MADRKGLLLILSSPSGAGKSTLTRMLMDWDPGIRFSISATTRKPRPGDEDGREWIDALEDDSIQAAEAVEGSHDADHLRTWLVRAMQALNPRERYIVAERKLKDEPRTLESLGEELGLSKERVRQLEAAAFAKMRRNLEAQSREVYELLS